VIPVFQRVKQRRTGPKPGTETERLLTSLKFTHNLFGMLYRWTGIADVCAGFPRPVILLAGISGGEVDGRYDRAGSRVFNT